MSSSILAELLIKLGLDARGVIKGVDDTKAAMGSLGGGTKAAMTIVGGAAALGFAALARGAMDAERAQGDFMAATGRSREEAQQFTHDMNGLAGTAGTVGLSFQQITGAGIKVAEQFKVTGAEGTALTGSILNFAKATGQGIEVVDGLDGALGAFGEPAGRAVGLMDQLVASHQKYGTDVGPSSLDALNKMAPALGALNLGLDDGVSLLNLFESAELDSSVGAAALRIAVGKLKPGQSLDDLIQQVSSIEDPTLRAQKATELFGRQGVALSNALKPGITSLDDFAVSSEDAAGAADKASDAMLTTTDRIKQWIEKGVAGIRDVGQSLGPAVTGLASFGSLAGSFLSTDLGKKLRDPIIKGITVGWTSAMKLIKLPVAALTNAISGALSGLGEAIAGNKTVQAGMDKAGGMLGGRLGTAIKFAAAAALGLLAVELWNQFKEISDQNSTTQKSIDSTMDAFLAGAPTRAEVEARLAALKSVPEQLDPVARGVFEAEDALGNAFGGIDDLFGRDTTSAKATWMAAITDLENYLANGAPAQVNAGLDALGNAVDDQGRTMGDGFVQEFVGGVSSSGSWGALADLAAANKAGKAIASGVGRGIADGSTEVVSALDELKYVLEHGLTPKQQVAQVLGHDWIATFKKGMESAIPGAKEAAQNAGIEALQSLSQVSIGSEESKRIGQIVTRLYASGMDESSIVAALAAQGVGLDALLKLGAVQGWNATGVTQMFNYANGITSQEGTAGAAAGGVADAASNALNVSGFTYGVHLATTYLAGIRSKYGDAIRTGDLLAERITRSIAFSAPPKVGPLRRIREFGPHMIENWLGPMLEAGRRLVTPAGLTLASALAGPLEGGPRGWSIAGGTPARFHNPHLSDSAGGGDHYHEHWHVGTLVATDGGIDDLDRKMERRRRLRKRGSGRDPRRW